MSKRELMTRLGPRLSFESTPVFDLVIVDELPRAMTRRFLQCWLLWRSKDRRRVAIAHFFSLSLN